MVRLLRDGSDGEAVELNPLRPQDIDDRICYFVFDQKPLFLYGTTLDGIFQVGGHINSCHAIELLFFLSTGFNLLAWEVHGR